MTAKSLCNQSLCIFFSFRKSQKHHLLSFFRYWSTWECNSDISGSFRSPLQKLQCRSTGLQRSHASHEEHGALLLTWVSKREEQSHTKHALSPYKQPWVTHQPRSFQISDLSSSDRSEDTHLLSDTRRWASAHSSWDWLDRPHHIRSTQALTIHNQPFIWTPAKLHATHI